MAGCGSTSDNMYDYSYYYYAIALGKYGDFFGKGIWGGILASAFNIVKYVRLHGGTLTSRYLQTWGILWEWDFGWDSGIGMQLGIDKYVDTGIELLCKKQ